MPEYSCVDEFHHLTVSEISILTIPIPKI